MMSTLHKVVGLGSWLITSLASINVGLEAFGYDFFAADSMFMERFPMLRMPLMYVVGLAGVVCLVMFIKTITGHCHCGSSSCSSCSGNK